MTKRWSVPVPRSSNGRYRTLQGVTDARAKFMSMAKTGREVAVCAYLDPKWRIVGLRHFGSHAIDRVTVPTERVARDSLTFGAAAVLLAHSHPSGDETPSAEDIALTRRLVRGLDAIGVRLVDHLILAGARCTSFRSLGLL